MTKSNTYLPGRLGNPDSTLENDPRADPRIVAAVLQFGGFAPGVEAPEAGASYEDCLAYCEEFERTAALANPELLAALPVFESVKKTTEFIEGADGNKIKLLIHKPVTQNGPLSCVIHLHGGGMVMMSTEEPGYIRWRDSLSDMGIVAIGVEFRNGGGALGAHPFPAGLNDCASAVRWVRSNMDSLGISSVVVSGESGGGNLALATALKAKQEGWINEIDGVYAMCPYILGQYAEPPANLLSLAENDGYMLDCVMMTSLVKVYDPEGQHADNPLAWPYHASIDELKDLPPHVISVNELDPLRDEGLAYYSKLLSAGVSVVGRTVNGTPHAGDQGFPDITPEVYQETLRSIVGFACSL